MKAFVIGATGFVGGAIADRLRADGHTVTGLARDQDAADRLAARGITPVQADLGDRVDAALAAGAEADAVVLAAQLPPAVEEEMADALTGIGKTLLLVSGTGVFLQRTGGAWSPDAFAEDDPFTPEPLAVPRVRAEQRVRAGARGIVVRPPLLWGPGDHGHVSEIYRSVAVTGAACYVGDGLNTYSHLHVDDAARLVVAALERGTPGALYHGVAGEVPNRWIAEAVARDLGCPTRSLSPAEAATVWGEFGALIMGASSRARTTGTAAALGWSPTHRDMLSMIGEPRLRALAVPITAPSS
ncbi:NAD-dependent epimerase/dehydratase family protein [Catenuloplanes japonicus]|uniref:NAD-dependent epimerase/dehydratase family protein n=1 Tax=Catenuloplanes japonicus TaxID=33876 RepID=UPI000526CCE7|nr:NAD-dependent epimerase/dehydratase family protein [Catenuloplanes japonicus]